ncbi:MAG: VCBS repeat-containing protein, partial [Flavobacteriaceae bacterium]|nr:VCBS repeat-containing protein [Flavobacteriaceae bacterium]
FNNGGSVSIRLGDGLGGFTGSTNISVGSNSKEVAIGDFNGDGNQDLAVSNPSSNYVSILMGNGTGVFSAGTNVVVVNDYQSVVIGDFNNDGKQDLAMSSHSTNKVSIKLGNGAGLFNISSEVTVGTGPWSLAMGDFNADGFQDIATSNTTSGTISIRLGDGLGGFSGTTDLTVASSPQSITIGDFNGDGLQDIATANTNSNSVSIRLATVANINLQGNGTTIASGDTTPTASNATDFGGVIINTATIKTYTIQNTGTAALTISSIASSGTNAADFVVGGITLPATIAAGANSTFTVTLTTTTSGEKTATVTVNNDNCDEGTYTFAVKVASWNTAIWTGALSSTWSVIGNWNNNVVPTADYSVTIPNVATTPDITSAVQVANLTIDASSSLSISSGGSLIVDQDINTTETITMESDATNSSVLVVNGTYTGSVTYKRGGLLANKWGIVSAPVHGQSIKDFAENAQNSIRINTSVTPNRYAIAYYDDSRAIGAKWVYYTTTDLAGNALTFEKGTSYAVSRATNGSVTFTGTLETLTLGKSVIASQWNAVGNPYTTFYPINKNSGKNFIDDNINNLDAANVGVYVWDIMQSKYIGKSLLSDESSFAPGQGFFIKAKTGATVVFFIESERKIQPVSGGDFNKGEGTVIPSIQLKVASKGVILDTNIKYFENATIGLDPGYDLENFGRGVFDIYTHLLDDIITKKFTIQSLPDSSYNRMIIPIGLKSESGEDLSFSVNTSGLPEGMEVFIEDKELDVLIKLDLSTTYDVHTTAKLNGVGRFYLHTKQRALSAEGLGIKDVKIYYHKDDNSLMVNGIFHGDFNVKLYTVLGTSIVDETFEGNGINSIRLSNVSKGVYIVKVSSELGNISKKIIIE